jgi:hypothetical protein
VVPVSEIAASFKVAGVLRDTLTGDVGYECSHDHGDQESAVACAENALRVVMSQQGKPDIRLPEKWFLS